jgi:Flp pilus assembly protein TadB
VTVVLAGACAALAAAGVAGLVVPPTRRLAPRLRPYTLLARARLGQSADVLAASPPAAIAGGAFGRLLGPPVATLVAQVSRVVERRNDDVLRTALTHAGLFDATPDDYRARVAAQTLLFGGSGAIFGLLVLHSAAFTLALAGCGSVFGASRARGRVDRAVAERRERIRLELYTVNQLLAMHVRTGAGPIQATQRVVDRGRGALVDELAGVLRLVRSGTLEPEAFRRAAVTTSEPNAARTYKLFAAGAERGVDLAGGLRALSEDLRDARRDDLRKRATKRRAAMLVPTIAVLAPVMLLFIAAPLPSIVFGSR